jgi:hypothetical protein
LGGACDFSVIFEGVVEMSINDNATRAWRGTAAQKKAPPSSLVSPNHQENPAEPSRMHDNNFLNYGTSIGHGKGRIRGSLRSGITYDRRPIGMAIARWTVTSSTGRSKKMEQYETNGTVRAGCSTPMENRRAEGQELVKIREKMEVISSCGCHVGTVDRIEDGKIKLTKDEPQASGHHHYIPTEWVAKVDNKVYLNKDAQSTMHDWEEEPVGWHPL